MIYGHILLQQSIYSYILLCTLYICHIIICVYTTKYLTQGLSLGLGLVLFLKSNAIVYLEMYFFSKAMLQSSADIHKQGYFITLVSGCLGSQCSKGFEINEDILRYATVHTLIYACFLVCIWTPLESWLPGQPLEVIYVCVYQLIYCSIALEFSYGKENEKNVLSTNLYIQISIYRYKTLYPSMKPVYLGIYAYEQVQDRIYAYERGCHGIAAFKSVYTSIYAYVTFCKTCMILGFEPGILCILQGCSDNYATSDDTYRCIIWYLYGHWDWGLSLKLWGCTMHITFWLMLDVLRWAGRLRGFTKRGFKFKPPGPARPGCQWVPCDPSLSQPASEAVSESESICAVGLGKITETSVHEP